jgi:hypothetical protein
MKKAKYIYLLSILAFMLRVMPLYPQGEANFWFFGKNAGLDFSSGKPLSIIGKLNALESNTCISDPNGELLFYTDGVRIWNRKHNIMPGDTDLAGHISATQGGMTFAMKDDHSKYYLFLLGASEQDTVRLSYSIVDMSLDSGRGDIIDELKNIPLAVNLAEKISSVKHSNGSDYWVLVHEWGSARFLAYKVGESGYIADPVVSEKGSVHSGYKNNRQGYMKISVDGKRLALAVLADTLIEIFDFNNATGIVSNPISLRDTMFNDSYGLEFSPDATKLYISQVDYPSSVYQLDLTQADAKSIISTAKKISPDGVKYYYGGMQLGPDDKIYIAVRSNPNLSVINQPDSLYPLCDFGDKAISLSQGTCLLGSPNFVQSIFQGIHVTSNGPLCEGDTLMLGCDNIIASSFAWTGPDGFSSDEQYPVINGVGKKNKGIYYLTAVEVSGKVFKSSIFVDIVESELDFESDGNKYITSSCLGTESYGSLEITNPSEYYTELSGVRLKDSPAELELLPPPLPLRIPPKGIYQLNFRFKPVNPGVIGDSVLVALTQPCPKGFAAYISAEGFSTTTSIWTVSDTFAVIGAYNFCIPLYARLNCPKPLALDLGYEAILRFTEGNYLVTSASDATIIDNYHIGRDQYIKLKGTASKLDSIPRLLSYLCGDILLGEKDTSRIIIESFAWSDSLIDHSTRGGTLYVYGLCFQNGARLDYRRKAEISLAPIPASDHISLNITNPLGGDYKARIFNSLGELLHIYNIEIPEDFKGEFVEEIDISGIASGTYLLVLEGSRVYSHKPLLIIK